MNDKEVFIMSAAYVAKEVERQENVEVKSHIVATVMKEDMGMRYRRIKQITMKQNSDRNILLR